MLKVLSVGNSFSQDAQKWLKPICDAADFDIKLGNLFIGGCSLETHCNNLIEDRRDYSFEINADEGRPSSIREAVDSDDWDIVTFQQASHLSGKWETYEPYLSILSEKISRLSPRSKQYIHEVWGYEQGSKSENFKLYDNDSAKMYYALRDAYIRAARLINAPIIPTGDAVRYLRTSVPAFDLSAGGVSLCRDDIHLSLDLGRYAAAAVWFETLTGLDIHCSDFVPTVDGKPADERLIALIKDSVHFFLQSAASTQAC